MRKAKEKAKPKKVAKGATKKRRPFPFKKFGSVFAKAVLVIGVLGITYLLVQWARDLSWRPMAIKQYQLEQTLVFQDLNAVDDVVGKYLGKSLLMVDLMNINQNLETLPWIRQSNVRKVWPGKLEINLVEHEPVAYWNDQEVLNSEGIPLLRPQSTMTLSKLYGPEGKSALVMENYLQFARVFREQNQSVEEVTMRPRGAWSIKLATGIDIYLGEKNMLERSRRVVQVLKSDAFDNESIQYIDARYPNGVAVKMNESDLNEVKDDIAA